MNSMAITINIAKNPRKVFLSKYGWGHDGKYEGWKRNLQTSPGLRGGKPKPDCREQSTGRIDTRVIDIRSTDSRTAGKFGGAPDSTTRLRTRG